MKHAYIYDYYPYSVQVIGKNEEIVIDAEDTLHNVQIGNKQVYSGLYPVIFGNSLEMLELGLEPKENVIDIESTPLINVHFEAVEKKWRNKLRSAYYKKGFFVKMRSGEKVHFVRYKRSASSARSGSCLFIRKDLHSKMNAWSDCGLNPKSPLVKQNYVAYEAYKALTLSTCENFFSLDLSSLLIVDDLVSTFHTNAYTVTDVNDTGETNILTDHDYPGVELVYQWGCNTSNTIWDGEGLMDESIFNTICDGKYAHKGMMLLRNRFFKSCVFNTKLTEWFHHNGLFGVIDHAKLNGYTQATTYENIKMVVTYSSLKYLKFFAQEEITKGIEQWLANADPLFGIIKADKRTNFFEGNCVRTNYQLLNTLYLPQDQVKALIEPFKRLVIDKIDTDIDYYLYYLLNSKRSLSYEEFISSDVKEYGNYFSRERDSYITPVSDLSINEDFDLLNETFLTLVSLNYDFGKTSMFVKIARRYAESIMTNLRNGKFPVSGTNATMFGNPYEFLLHIVKKFDVTSYQENREGVTDASEHIVTCTRFKDDTKLIGARSPHVMNGNLLVATNKLRPELMQWFNLTDEIVCVNSIGRDIQETLNGADFDSDFILLTDNETINDWQRRSINDIYLYNKFFPPHNHIQGKQSTKTRKPAIAQIDNQLANNSIGRIINLAQWYNSIFWDTFFKTNDISACADAYYHTCILEVLSNVELDSAKGKYKFAVKPILDKMTWSCKKQTNDKKPVFMRTAVNQYMLRDEDYYLTPMDFLVKNVPPTVNSGRPTQQAKVKFYQLIEPEALKFERNEIGGPDRTVVQEFLNEANELGIDLGKRRRSDESEESYNERKKLLLAKIEELYRKYAKSVIHNEKRVRFALYLMKKTKAFINYYNYSQYLQLYLLTRDREICLHVFKLNVQKVKIEPCVEGDFFLAHGAKKTEI